MKKILLIVAVISLLAVNAFAFEPIEVNEKWNFSVTSSAVIPAEDDFSTGVSVNGVISYDIMPVVAVGVETGWTTFEVDDEGVDLGRAHQINILGDIILKYPVEVGDGMIFVPYLTNGFGGQITNVDESDVVSGLNVELEADNSFLYKLAAGFDFYLTEMLALNFEAAYYWSEAEWRAVFSGSTVGDNTYSANAFYIGGGLKLKF